MAPEADPLARFVARLRAAGIAMDAEWLADTLWLAGRLDADGAPAPGGERSDPATFSPWPAGGARPSTPGAWPPDEGEYSASGQRIALRALDPDGSAAQHDAPQIGVPVATAFPGLLPLERALRPLQRYRPRVVRPQPGALDEAATAETSARSGHIAPVFEEVRRREATLLLIMDDSPSMVVWDQMLEELRLVCEQVGAFRDVAVHYLRPRRDGAAGLATGPGGDPLAPADRLRDPTGRSITLLLSDCMGALWRSGAAQRLLYRFASTGPVAVVQPLPQRMWSRTVLPAEPGTLRGTEASGGRLEFVPRRRRSQPKPPGSLAVPVLAPTSAALGAWARTVSGTAGSAANASAAWVHDRHPGAEPRPRPPRTPEQVVRDFQATASPAAQHLAAYLSAAPLSYPVMQLVQRAMVPQTGPVEMAEVLLSELIVRRDDGSRDQRLAEREVQAADPAGRRAAGPWYEFAPGVREVLLRRLSLGEASLVLKHCSLYVERVFGRRARNFPALVVGYLSGAQGPVDGGEARGSRVPEAFAEVSQQVLLRFEPGGVDSPGRMAGSGNGEAGEAGERTAHAVGVEFGHLGRVVEEAAERLERFRQHGTIRDLWEAIRLLRGAPDDRGRPSRTVRAHALLARCLLSLWEARRDDGVLDAAEQAARSACTLADGAQLPAARAAEAHQVLGQVLQAVAGRCDSAGDRGQVLAEAAEHLDHAYRLSAAEPAARLALQLRSVQVARERYGITGDPLLLDVALGRLDEALAAGPSPPAAALSAHGGVLLDLAKDAQRRDALHEARALALRAAADFTSAAGTLEPAAERCRTLLELADARVVAAQDSGAPQAVEALRRALAAAEDDDDLRLECLRRLGRALAAQYTQTGEVRELVAADQALAAALRLVPADDPLRAELLAERGAGLVEWAARGGGLAVATDAVRVLREALAHTAESDPSLAERRLLFGRALHGRRQAGGAPTDLHEAEWILARAARGAQDSGEQATAARAWLERGAVLLALVQGPGAPEQLDRAGGCYRRAAECALRAGELLLAAQAHHQRGMVLERTAGRARALEYYRQAWQLWQRAGAAEEPQARSTLDRLLALGDQDEP